MRGLCLTLLLSIICCQASAVGPNVLFLISDDLNCDLGTYGHPRVQSPNIDKLANQGIRFDRAYVQYPVCNPSRTSFLTGYRPETTRILGNDVPFRKNLPDVVTLPELFRKNGYVTAGLGKVFHRGLSPDEHSPERDDARSWDHNFYGKTTKLGRQGASRDISGGVLPWCRWLASEGGDEDQHDGQLAAEAVRLLHDYKDKPFFIAVGFYRPHDPFHSPKKYFDQYPLDSLTLPEPLADRSAYPNLSIPGGTTFDVFRKFTETDKREFLRAYYAGISYMDAQLGKILNALDELDLRKNTLIVFIGDHGYELGVRDWWNKSTLFERSCRTPLIIAGPSIQPSVTSSLVEFVDLYPTLADLCQLEAPKNLAGVSLKPILADPKTSVKDAAFTTVARGPSTGLSIRTERYRYTEWNEGKQGVELYEHAKDPGEWHNLAKDPNLDATRTALSEKLRLFREQTPKSPEK